MNVPSLRLAAFALACLCLLTLPPRLAADSAVPTDAAGTAGGQELQHGPGASQESGASSRLTITVNGRSTPFTRAEFAALPHQEATAFDAHEKTSHVYSGVPARLLLERGGIAFGEKLRGKGLTQIVIAHTRDHYDVVYALAEFDPNFNPRTILVVDREDGRPLSALQGPYRLLIPGDKRPARWARMLTGLDVVYARDADRARW